MVKPKSQCNVWVIMGQKNLSDPMKFQASQAQPGESNLLNALKSGMISQTRY